MTLFISLKELWIAFTGNKWWGRSQQWWRQFLRHLQRVCFWCFMQLHNHVMQIQDRYGTIHWWRPIHWCASIQLELIYGYTLQLFTCKPMVTKFLTHVCTTLFVIVPSGLTSHIISSSLWLLTGSLCLLRWANHGACSSSSLVLIYVAIPRINYLNI